MGININPSSLGSARRSPAAQGRHLVAAIVALALVVSAIAAWYILQQRAAALRQRETAEQQRKAAEQQRKAAEQQRRLDRSRVIALLARSKAVTAVGDEALSRYTWLFAAAHIVGRDGWYTVDDFLKGESGGELAGALAKLASPGELPEGSRPLELSVAITQYANHIRQPHVSEPRDTLEVFNQKASALKLGLESKALAIEQSSADPELATLVANAATELTTSLMASYNAKQKK